MGALTFVGFLAVMTGFSLLVLGGGAGSKASFSHGDTAIVGRAWFVVLVLGFLMMAMDAYMASGGLPIKIEYLL
jgi:hypothetical protein